MSARLEPPYFLDDLASHIIARRRGVSMDELVVSADDLEPLKAELHHQHLPLMDEIGLLDYEPAANVVYVADDEWVSELCQRAE